MSFFTIASLGLPTLTKDQTAVEVQVVVVGVVADRVRGVSLIHDPFMGDDLSHDHPIVAMVEVEFPRTAAMVEAVEVAIDRLLTGRDDGKLEIIRPGVDADRVVLLRLRIGVDDVADAADGAEHHGRSEHQLESDVKSALHDKPPMAVCPR